MIQKSLIAICLMTAAVISCSVKSDPNWGKSVCGCQLSIGLSTNIVTTGSSAYFYIRITNSSSGIVNLNPQKWIAFTLTNTVGKVYQLEPIVDAGSYHGNSSAIPGGTIELNWRVKFCVYVEPREYALPEDAVLNLIEPGDYVILPITREITTADKKVCTLTSNSLKVKVVK